MQKETEIKFDVPIGIDLGLTIKKLEEIIQQNGFEIKCKKTIERTFQYYDNRNLDIYKKGETIRRVGGFDPKLYNGAYRYDFKIGPIENRYEESHWANSILNEEEILNKFNLKRFYAEISPSAYATTKHYQMKLKKGETVIEATLDGFKVQGGTNFNELEFELEQGNESSLILLSKPIQDQLGIRRIYQQKYNRIIGGLIRI